MIIDKITPVIMRLSVLGFFYLVINTIETGWKKDTDLQKQHMEYCIKISESVDRIDRRLKKAGFLLSD